jgi:hypothetical protein
MKSVLPFQVQLDLVSTGLPSQAISLWDCQFPNVLLVYKNVSLPTAPH